MDFILDDNNVKDTTNTEVTNQLIDDINSDINTIKAQVANIEDGISTINGDIDSLNNNKSSVNAELGRLHDELNSITAILKALLNDENIYAVEASIQTISANSISTKTIEVENPITADINNENITTNSVNANQINTSNINTTNSITTDKLKVNGELETDNFTINGDLTAENVVASNMETNTFSTKEITLNGSTIKTIDVKASGIDNAHLHKFSIRANGLVVFDLNNSTITISGSTVSSNYGGLYSASVSNGIVTIYISEDIDCRAVIIGNAEITSSMVLKSSVRRNADENGQPNTENTVKVAVVSALPQIGQKNVIYVVLGDCAYYCDGSYFYEMASKKRG